MSIKINISILSLRFVLNFAALLMLLNVSARAQDAEDVRPHEPTTNVISLSADIFGDSMDMSSGAASFYTVDVSLPGNSGLPVQFGRRYDSENKWIVDAPRLENITYCDSLRPSLSLPDGADEQGLEREWYTRGGLQLHVPNHSIKTMIRSHVTEDYWKRSCLTHPTFLYNLVTAPNGDKYYFDVENGDHSAELYGDPAKQELGLAKLYASKIEDVHGNWVEYQYLKDNDNNVLGVTSIIANDGREITVSYNSDNKVDTVTTTDTVTASTRTWAYSYYPTGEKGLKRVTLPDGNYWEYSNNMEVFLRKDVFNRQFDVGVTFPTVTVRHPFGAEMKYKVRGIRNGEYRETCTTNNPPNPYSYSSYAVIEKKLELINETRIWGYNYQQDNGSCTGNIARTKIRNLTLPDGSKKKLYVNRERGNKIKGRIEKEETLSATNQVIRTVETEFIFGVGSGFDTNVQVEKRTITQDTDIYTTEYEYDFDTASSTYSYGRPLSVKTSSDITGSTAERETVTTYKHDTTKWILGLPETVGLKEGSTTHQISRIEYDGNGQVKKKFSYDQVKDIAEYGYYPNGTVNWIEDAKDRRTTFETYKRGKPTKVTSAITNIITHSEITDDGWVKSQTDPKGRKVDYEYDSMGRVTLIKPPTSSLHLSPTTILNGSTPTVAFIQVIDKAYDRTYKYYDGLLRPVVTRRFDRLKGISTYVTTQYDGVGRVKFKSFPSATLNTTSGTSYTYDALGRMESSKVTVGDGAETKYDYLSGNRTQVTDGEGKITTTTRNGYGGPGGGEVIKIQQPEGVTTGIVRNIWDEIEQVTQFGLYNTTAISLTQKFYYDPITRRLCRHHVPESGSKLYAYNDAGELTSYSRGMAAGTDCTATPSGPTKVTLTYDAMGRLDITDYADPDTPDIDRLYNQNSQLTRIDRGDISSPDWNRWAYSYDAHNRLAREALIVHDEDSEYDIVFDMDYFYNAHGYLRGRRLPGGRLFYMSNDGLGRTEKLSYSTQTYLDNITYHPDGSVAGLTYGNGLALTRGLNSQLQLDSLLVSDGVTTALDLSYTYDLNGRIDLQTDGVDSTRSRDYGYDDLGRLESVTSASFGNASYLYDPLGNIRQKTLRGGTVTMGYDLTGTNRTGRLTSVVDTRTAPNGGTGSRNLTYDSRGNVEVLGGLTFEYDMADQPGTVSGQNAQGEAVAAGSRYAYDGNHKRFKSVVNGKTIYNVYDVTGRLTHVDEWTDGKMTDYMHAAGMTIARIENNKFAYLHPDHLGSAQSGTKGLGYPAGEVGDVKWTESYTPYGEALDEDAANDNQAGFTGHIKDNSTGLNYMQARYFDPAIGRFLSTDPVTFLDTGEPGYFNRFGYTFNDPVNNMDSTGKYVEGEVIGNNVTLVLPVQQGGFANSGQMIPRIAGGAHQWSGKYGKYNVKIETVMKSDTIGRTNTVVEKLGRGRAFVQGDSVYLYANSGGETPKHEVGHLLGLPDKYVDVVENGKVVGAVPKPGTDGATNLMGLGSSITEADITAIIENPDNNVIKRTNGSEFPPFSNELSGREREGQGG
ncbi:MAG: RHS repeat-associated core domain-containing protein [Hellea sp.]